MKCNRSSCLSSSQASVRAISLCISFHIPLSLTSSLLASSPPHCLPPLPRLSPPPPPTPPPQVRKELYRLRGLIGCGHVRSRGGRTLGPFAPCHLALRPAISLCALPCRFAPCHLAALRPAKVETRTRSSRCSRALPRFAPCHVAALKRVLGAMSLLRPRASHHLPSLT